MKWLKDPATGRDMLGLHPDEAQTVARLLQTTRREAAKKYEHYNAIHEAGEATDRQQTLMAKYADEMGFIDMFTTVAE